MKIAIVTGASSGIGSEFCRLIDNESLDEIWIIARRADRLETLAASMKTGCRVIPADLTDRSDMDSIMELLSSEKHSVQYLINCAGFGVFGTTVENRIEDICGMIDLNCSALAEITSRTIPFMSSGSSIIEVCSASAYLPLPFLNVYASTKAFVRSFCDGLRPELSKSGINVLEVSPGWVETDFISRSTSEFSVSEKVFAHTVTPKAVAEQAMADLRKGRMRSICGGYNRFQVFCCRHLPSMASRIWMKSLH